MMIVDNSSCVLLGSKSSNAPIQNSALRSSQNDHSLAVSQTSASAGPNAKEGRQRSAANLKSVETLQEQIRQMKMNLALAKSRPERRKDSVGDAATSNQATKQFFSEFMHNN